MSQLKTLWNTLHERPLFWKSKSVLSGFTFGVRKLLFRLREQSLDAKSSVRIFINYFPSFAVYFSLSLCAAFLLNWVLGPLLKENIPSWVEMDASTYSAILKVVASVTGIFIALHFSGLTAVVSSHQNIGDDIRDLIIDEKVGKDYVRFLILTVSVSLALLLYQSLGHAPNAVTAYLAVALAILAMVAFTQLVRIHFKIMGPGNLGALALSRLAKNAKSVTVGHLGSNHSAFQSYYRTIATKTLITLQRLLAIAEKTNSDDAQILCTRLAHLLGQYSKLKMSIPPKSEWYDEIPDYPAWYAANNFKLEIATKTSTPLTPEMKTNHQWFEDRCIEILIRHCRARLEESDQLGAANTLKTAAYLFELFGSEVSTKYAQRIQREFHDEIQIAFKQDSSDTEMVYWAEAETLFNFPIQSWLGFYHSLGRLLPENLRHVAPLLLKRNYSAAFKSNPHFCLSSLLQKFHTELQFEHEIEGEYITPIWYLEHRLNAEAMNHIAHNIEIVPEVLDYYVSSAKTLAEDRRHRLASIAITRGMEYIAKVLHGHQDCEACHKALDPNTNLKSYQIVEIAWGQLRSSLKEAYERLQEALANLIVHLKDDIPSSDRPDFLGQAIHHTAEAIYTRMKSNDTEGVAKLLVDFFNGSLALTDRMQKKYKDDDALRFLLLGNEPLFDLLELSGLAFAWSEYHQNRSLWTSWKTLWNMYLEKDEFRKKILPMFATWIRFKRQSIQMTPRDQSRTRWSMEYEQEVRKLPRKLDDIRDFIVQRTVIDHTSAVVQLAGEEMSRGIDGIELFEYCYLANWNETEDLDFGRNSVAEALRYRESRKRSSSLLQKDETENE